MQLFVEPSKSKLGVLNPNPSQSKIPKGILASLEAISSSTIIRCIAGFHPSVSKTLFNAISLAGPTLPPPPVAL